MSVPSVFEYYSSYMNLWQLYRYVLSPSLGF